MQITRKCYLLQSTSNQKIQHYIFTYSKYTEGI